MTRKVSFLTTAEFAKLNHASTIVVECFGWGTTYLVGSATQKDSYRDVDIRTVLPDEDFDAMFGGKVFFWSLFCLGVATYLREVTGLPIDYQVQRRTEANENFAGQRNPIGTRGRPLAGGGDATPFNIHDAKESAAEPPSAPAPAIQTTELEHTPLRNPIPKSGGVPESEAA